VPSHCRFGTHYHKESARCQGGSPFHRRMLAYIARGFYFEQSQRLWSYFQISSQQTFHLLEVTPELGLQRLAT
jgi:hypothetical protein